MPKAAHFATRQAAADNAVAYSVYMGWGCTGTRVRTAHIPNGPYLSMAKHDDGKWRHIDWCSSHLVGIVLNPMSVCVMSEEELLRDLDTLIPGRSAA